MVRAEIISGLPENSKIGFHIHTDAFDGEDCASTGGHYNPQGVDHGAWFDPTDMRHVGDFKQLWVNQAGAASYRYQDNQASLYETDDRYDFDTFVGGRGMVIHMGTDDEGNGGDGTKGNGGRGNAKKVVRYEAGGFKDAGYQEAQIGVGG